MIEYALLTAFIGLAGAGAWMAIASSLGAYYQANDTRTQGIYVTPDPLPATP